MSRKRLWKCSVVRGWHNIYLSDLGREGSDRLGIAEIRRSNYRSKHAMAGWDGKSLRKSRMLS